MFKYLLSSFLLIWLTSLSYAATQVPSSQIMVTTGLFKNCLDSSATNVQKALNEIDNCFGSNPPVQNIQVTYLGNNVTYLGNLVTYNN
jgi:hypothetical protein